MKLTINIAQLLQKIPRGLLGCRLNSAQEACLACCQIVESHLDAYLAVEGMSRCGSADVGVYRGDAGEVSINVPPDLNHMTIHGAQKLLLRLFSRLHRDFRCLPSEGIIFYGIQ